MVHAVVDNRARIFVNGGHVRDIVGGWQSGTRYPKVPIVLKPGQNAIHVETINWHPPSPGGLLLSIIDEAGRVLTRTGGPGWSIYKENGAAGAASIFNRTSPPVNPAGTAPSEFVNPPQKGGMEKYKIWIAVAIAVLLLSSGSMMMMMMMR
jgi:hypothetical protein